MAAVSWLMRHTHPALFHPSIRRPFLLHHLHLHLLISVLHSAQSVLAISSTQISRHQLSPTPLHFHYIQLNSLVRSDICFASCAYPNCAFRQLCIGGWRFLGHMEVWEMINFVGWGGFRFVWGGWEIWNPHWVLEKWCLLGWSSLFEVCKFWVVFRIFRSVRQIHQGPTSSHVLGWWMLLLLTLILIPIPPSLL